MTQIWINLLSQIFATRKAMAPFANVLPCWADQYGSIDTSKFNIGPLVIILWKNILGQQHVTLNFLLTTLPNRNFIASTAAALYYTAVELEKM